MYVEITSPLQGAKYTIWSEFLADAGLTPDPCVSQTVLIWEDSRLIATGSRQDNILKCIAIHKDHRGEDLTATILSALRQEAFRAGHRHLFLYTKPENQYLFSSLFFYPVAKTEKVLLMENQKDGIRSFLESLSVPYIASGDSQKPYIGAVVMNCNPFTLGHRYLIERAAEESEHLYVFVLSEDQSCFSAKDRLQMVLLGTRDLANVTVHPTGPYLISAATFPTYFLKEREHTEHIQCALDIEIFIKYFVPKFGITHRYVGTEPLSPMTCRYNEALKESLPQKGILVKEVPRLTLGEEPVSASKVRKLMDSHNAQAIRSLVPKTTYDYLQTQGLISET